MIPPIYVFRHAQPSLITMQKTRHTLAHWLVQLPRPCMQTNQQGLALNTVQRAYIKHLHIPIPEDAWKYAQGYTTCRIPQEHAKLNAVKAMLTLKQNSVLQFVLTIHMDCILTVYACLDAQQQLHNCMLKIIPTYVSPLVCKYMTHLKMILQTDVLKYVRFRLTYMLSPSIEDVQELA